MLKANVYLKAIQKVLVSGFLAAVFVFNTEAGAVGLWPAPAESNPVTETCDPILSKSFDLKLATRPEYRPVGYVTKRVVEQFSHSTPILFTEVYFTGLGKALADEKLYGLVNEKGLFTKKVSKKEKVQIKDLVGNDVQLQGRMAERIWRLMESKYALTETDLTPDRVLELTHQAGYKKSSEFTKTRSALLDSLSRRSQVVEFIRLSLNFGVTLAADGNRTKALIYSVSSGAFVGALTAAVTWVAAQMGTSDPGMWPVYLGLGSAALSGIPVYIYSLSQKENALVRFYRHWMNKNNQRILEENDLISEKDGENTLFIDGAYLANVESLQSKVNVVDIEKLSPATLEGLDPVGFEKAIFNYHNQLPEYVSLVNSFMDTVITGWRAKTVSMGEPIFALVKLFETDDNEKASQVPLSADQGLGLYRQYLQDVHGKVSEARSEFNALVKKYDEFLAYLEQFRLRESGRLNTSQVAKLETTIQEMTSARWTVEAFGNVAQAHLSQLHDENKLLVSTLQALAAARTAKRLDPQQREAVFGLIKVVEQARAEANFERTNDNDKQNAKAD